MSRSTKRSDAVPVLLLVSLSIALTAHRILKVTSSVGMLNTDSEGTTVMLHRALIPVADLEKSLNYLRSRKFEEHRFTVAKHTNTIYQTLDVIIFELR